MYLDINKIKTIFDSGVFLMLKLSQVVTKQKFTY